MKPLRIFVVLCAAAASVGAWALDGTIVNDKGKPCKGLAVTLGQEQVKTAKDGTFALSGSEGTLYVQVLRRERAAIPVDGAQAVAITVGKDRCKVAIDGADPVEVAYEHYEPPRHDPNIITRDEIERLRPRSLAELLRGRIAGVVVNGNSIYIRPSGTLNYSEANEANHGPLFIIDGVEVPGAQAEGRIIMDNVETVEVIRDSHMLGLKGASGIIKITTKGHTEADPVLK